MSTLSRVSIGAAAAGLCCLPLSMVMAQQANPRQLAPANRPILNRPANQTQQSPQPHTANYGGNKANSGQVSSVENYLANCMLKNNQAEIELSQFAAQQSQNQQVKQFAEELVKDHQKVVEQLQQFAGANKPGLENAARTEADRSATDATKTPGSSGTDTATLNATTGAPNANPGEQTVDGASVTGPRAAMQAGTGFSQLAAIEDKINERCNQALREELQAKSGAEFDECFVGSQIAGHMHMLAALEVISQDTQGQLKELADEAKPAVQKHLEHAKMLAKQMKSGAQSSTSAARPSASAEPQQ